MDEQIGNYFRDRKIERHCALVVEITNTVPISMVIIIEGAPLQAKIGYKSISIFKEPLLRDKQFALKLNNCK